MRDTNDKSIWKPTTLPRNGAHHVCAPPANLLALSTQEAGTLIFDQHGTPLFVSTAVKGWAKEQKRKALYSTLFNSCKAFAETAPVSWIQALPTDPDALLRCHLDVNESDAEQGAFVLTLESYGKLPRGAAGLLGDIGSVSNDCTGNGFRSNGAVGQEVIGQEVIGQGVIGQGTDGDVDESDVEDSRDTDRDESADDMSEVIEKVLKDDMFDGFMRMAVDSMTDVLLITEAEPLDEPGPRVLFVNKAFEYRTGYTRDEVIGRSPRFLQGPATDRRVLDGIRRALEEKKSVRAEVVNYTKAGLPFRVEMIISPVRLKDAKVTHYVSLQRWRSMQSDVFHVSGASTFRINPLMLDVASHELRTPLVSIVGFADLLLQHSDEVVRDHARLIQRAGERLECVYHNLLHLSHLESGFHAFTYESIDLWAFLSKMIGRYEERAREKGLAFNAHVPLGSLPKVRADRDVLKFALDALLDNAVKYTWEGGVEVDIQTTDSEVLLVIQDTGIGISQEHLHNIFNPFYQASQGHARLYEGLGLGLNIAHRFIALTMGSIACTSEKGVGSTFTLRLPLVVEDNGEG